MELLNSGGVSMEHKKNFFFSVTKETKHGTVYVEGPVPPEKLATYSFHEAWLPLDLQSNNSKP